MNSRELRGLVKLFAFVSKRYFADQGPGQYLRREHLLYEMGGAGRSQTTSRIYREVSTKVNIYGLFFFNSM